MQHEDPRVSGGHQPPQFPPPHAAAGAQPAAHHHAPDYSAPPPPPTEPYRPTDPRARVAEPEVMDEPEQIEFGDYFGFDLRTKYVMPDGKQWIEFRKLDEGGIAQYHKILDRDVTVEKLSGNARIKINQVQERHALLQVACVDWYMVQRDRRNGTFLPVKFNNSPGGTFMQWVLKADPEIVADLYTAIQKENPSLLQANQDTIEAIDKQMEQLAEQRAILVERMQGKPDSATS